MARASTVSVSIDGLEGAIKRVDEIIDLLSTTKNENSLLMRLGEIGSEKADEEFRNAIYDGYNDVRVDPPKARNENEVIINASGRSVAFIEFGSGVHYSAPVHPKADELGMIRGNFGYKLGRHDSWRYEGDPGTNGEIITDGPHAGEVLTHGNPANMCMYNAAKEIKQRAQEIAEEILL